MDWPDIWNFKQANMPKPSFISFILIELWILGCCFINARYLWLQLQLTSLLTNRPRSTCAAFCVKIPVLFQLSATSSVDIRHKDCNLDKFQGLCNSVNCVCVCVFLLFKMIEFLRVIEMILCFVAESGEKMVYLWCHGSHWSLSRILWEWG